MSTRKHAPLKYGLHWFNRTPKENDDISCAWSSPDEFESNWPDDDEWMYNYWWKMQEQALRMIIMKI